jgi:hypothetical protein
MWSFGWRVSSYCFQLERLRAARDAEFEGNLQAGDLHIAARPF